MATKDKQKARTRNGASRVVDFHVHMNPWHLLRPEVAATLERTQPDYKRIRRLSEDPDAFLRLMDKERIERACLINYVAPRVMGYTQETNEWVRAFAARDRDRLVPFGSLHPDHVSDAPKEIEKLLFTYELGGIKIHPPHMLLAPNAYLTGARTLELLYETCQSQGVPVMFHTGTSVFPGARNKFGDPMLIDDVAVDFPRLKIVLAHGGRPLWTDTASFLVRRHPNVWMDLSSIPPSKLLEYFPRLEDLAPKCLYGSDWPGPHVPGMRHNADAVARLPLSASAKKGILSGNSEKVLRRRN